MLPLFFKSLIDNISDDNIENYTNELYETYSKEKEEYIKELNSNRSIKFQYFQDIKTAENN